MGAYSPAPVFTPDLQARVMTTIIEPALAAMRRRGSPFRGLLFAGLMIGPDGPSLIEFNARFGDPETQAVLPRFQGDLLDALDACAHGRLAPEALAPLSPQSSLTVVLAAGGYPDAPRTGGLVEGLEAAEACEGVVVRHAGMKRVETGLVATGGRVLSVTGLGDTLQAARERAYRAMALIRLPGSFYRRDIGWRALGEGLASDLS
jgi:phosphoribosylamine--glycine ligase